MVNGSKRKTKRSKSSWRTKATRKANKTSYRRRNYQFQDYSKATTAKALANINVPRPVFSNSYSTTLRYVSNGHTLAPTVGVAASNVWSANGLFDPDITGTGHQPAGFDQMMAWYQQYCVHSCKVTVLFNQSSAQVLHNYVGVYAKQNTTPEVSSISIRENGNGVHTKLNIPAYGDGNMATLTYSINLDDYTGFPNLESSQQMKGTATSNPNQQFYFHVWAAPPTASSTLVQYEIMLEYYATFTNPVQIPMS